MENKKHRRKKIFFREKYNFLSFAFFVTKIINELLHKHCDILQPQSVASSTQNSTNKQTKICEN